MTARDAWDIVATVLAILVVWLVAGFLAALLWAMWKGWRP